VVWKDGAAVPMDRGIVGGESSVRYSGDESESFLDDDLKGSYL